MIERVYLKEHLTFDEVELRFDEVELNLSKGLMIFTGPSGSGKSVLMQGILSIFGYFNAKAKVSEAIITNKLDLSDYGILIDDEDITFKQIKKEKTRYFINNQTISKKKLQEISNKFISYLSVRDENEYSSNKLIKILDNIIIFHTKEYKVLLNKYDNLYKIYKQKYQILQKIIQKEKNLQDEKEFLEFEIEKIEKINPQENEFEELMQIKKQLSKAEKIQESIHKAETIFDFETHIIEALNLLEQDSDFFSETINELRQIFENALYDIENLKELEIETILDRLSQLQSLINKYGSIKEALNVLQQKKLELDKLNNISFEKENLQKEVKILLNDLQNLAQQISQKRKNYLNIFEDKLNSFLKQLYLTSANIKINNIYLNENGIDEIILTLNDEDISTLSTGEFNRFRLALLATSMDYMQLEDKTLFVDEIDSNLSGEESMSVAKVLKQLSKKYQIFAISHQPQLTSIADKHFLITKIDKKSNVKELNTQQRIQEIARMISGANITKEALDFANNLLKDNLC